MRLSHTMILYVSKVLSFTKSLKIVLIPFGNKKIFGQIIHGGEGCRIRIKHRTERKLYQFWYNIHYKKETSDGWVTNYNKINASMVRQSTDSEKPRGWRPLERLIELLFPSVVKSTNYTSCIHWKGVFNEQSIYECLRIGL